MIKFVIGLIALIFVALAVYVYTDKKGEEVTKSAVTKSVVEKEVVKQKPISVTKEVSSKTKPKMATKDEVLVKSATKAQEKTISSNNEIGEGLTLEGIENADVSDEEKERMRIDALIYHSKHLLEKEPLNREEMNKIIEDGVKDGIL